MNCKAPFFKFFLSKRKKEDQIKNKFDLPENCKQSCSVLWIQTLILPAICEFTAQISFEKYFPQQWRGFVLQIRDAI